MSSINFSQNPEFIKDQQGNFGAGIPTPETPHQVGMLADMGLPTTPNEFVKFMPYFIPAVGASVGLSKLATNATRFNPAKDAAMTAADSYKKSSISRMTNRIDGVVSPITTKYASQINSSKSFLNRHTPQWVKNLWEKITIGVTPRNHMALSQYKGMTVMQLDNFLGKLRELPPAEIQRLGLENILAVQGGNSVNLAKAAIEKLNGVSASALKNLKSAKGKDLHILEEFTKSKAFLGIGGKTAIGRGAQRGLMMVSEAAGGGVVGASWFGIIMNSIFLASTFKRTWNAPWGEKLSTFMEGALVDFCGGYLMALLGAKITYKLLGLKNADKTAAQLADIKNLTAQIVDNKALYKRNAQIIKAAEKAGKSCIEVIVDAAGTKQSIPLAQARTELASSAKEINTAIESLKKLRGFQKATGKGSFFLNLLHRPLRWVGNFFSVGLENVPEYIAGQTVKNGKVKEIGKLRVGWQHIKNSLKTIGGYPIRFFLVLAVITPPLTKLCAKISHTLFGKPTKSIMDEREGKKDNTKTQKHVSKNPNLVDMDTFNQYTKAVGTAREIMEAQQDPQGYARRKNSPPPKISQRLIDDVINSQTASRSPVINHDTATYIPSAYNSSNISPATYIPSSVGAMKEKSPLSDAVRMQASKADKLAKYVERELSQTQKDSFNF